MEQLLKYGLSDGCLRHISEVANGIKCKCTCANCGHPLVAKNNPANKKAAHFAHYSDKECEGAYESTLHLLAKILFKREKLIRVPDFHIDYDYSNNKSLFKKGSRIKFEHVEIEISVETKSGIIRPDAIGTKNGRSLFIEFAKTHFVDHAKKKKIKDSGVACIEIDLSEVLMLEDAILKVFNSNTNAKYWIINPRLEKEYYLKNEKKIKEEKARAEERLNRLNAYKSNNDVQVLFVFGQWVRCPKRLVALSELKTTNFYRHAVLKRIIDGEHWNAETYGYPPNPSHIYLKKEKILVYPAHKDQANLSHEALREARLFWAGLKKIEPIISNKVFGACHGCEFSVERIDIGKDTHQICKHPRVK